jgi:hypothetical protein
MLEVGSNFHESRELVEDEEKRLRLRCSRERLERVLPVGEGPSGYLLPRSQRRRRLPAA